MGLLQKIVEWDTELFLSLNSWHSSYWDTIMLMITRQETWFPFFAVIIFFIFKNYKSKGWLIVIFIAITVLISDQLSGLIKDVVQRYRPVYNQQIGHLVHNVLRKGGLYGFLSSHATNSFAVFVFTKRIFKNRGYSILMFLWALIFSYSRIYSGVHYPLDIICGAVLGAIIGFAMYKFVMFIDTLFFIRKKPEIEGTNIGKDQMGWIFMAFAVLISTVFIMAYILHHYNYL